MTSRTVVALVSIVSTIVTGACASDDSTTTVPPAAPTVPPQTEMEAGDVMPDEELDDEELAVEAYVAGYPLVVSVRTMQRLGGLLGVNRLAWQPALSGPQSRAIVAPNRDTLYSVAVLDLRSEPMVLTLPAVTDRYYTYQFLDAWTESFAYIGTRATGGRAGSWLIVPPAWDGDVPDGLETIRATTPLVFLLGRYLVDSDADIANVTAISGSASLRPLSAETGAAPPAAPPPLGEPIGTPQAIPTDASFYDELGDALAVNAPSTDAQRDLFARAEEIGIGPGRHPTDDPDADVTMLAAAAAAGYEKIVAGAPEAGAGTGGWIINDRVGRYGDDTLARATVARIGWGANIPEEAVYPVARVDTEGAPLDGRRTYRIVFPAGGLPPVDGFWSLSVYGADMFFADHSSGRYTIGDRTSGLAYGDDGSVEIVLSHTQPETSGSGSGVNWLPVPEGRFVLMLRLYLPRREVIDGDYAYPAIEPFVTDD